ncbi:MAG: chemotaxis protein CheC [Candidatus Omnitrophota bacterium]
MTKMDDAYLDILKEVGNICSGNASIALAQILGRKIELEIPSHKILSLNTLSKELEEPNKVIVGVHMQILGAISGDILLIFPEKSAFALVDLLAQNNRNGNNVGGIAELGVSTLKEIGNIIISAYLGALGTITKMVILHSTPNLACGTVETIFSLAFSKIQKYGGEIILIETYFNEEEHRVNGNFYITFDSESIKKVLAATPKTAEG